MPFFQEAERVIVNGGNFVDNGGADNRKGEGIKLLLSHVLPEAIHDSDSRGDLGCLPGTRVEYISTITRWGRGEWEPQKQAFLMTGPAGAGKSAIARTCARELNEMGNLGASFFFYRPSGWNDPKKFVPTIVYQLTTQYSAYRDYIDAIILGNPLVLKKEMRTQFQELLVKPPLRQIVKDHGRETDLVIIVDGLDECETVDAQRQIIELITTSVHERTTPFSWAFFSRPEPPITSAFSSGIPISVSWTLPLSLSGDADSDIEAYLRHSFQEIRAKLNIPIDEPWPAEEDISHLVSQSAGLFAYAATAIRYIAGLGNGTSGLEQRLRRVLQVDSPSTENPFSALDDLYTLLMVQVPEGILYDTLSLLFLHQIPAYYHYYTESNSEMKDSHVVSYCLALGLSTTAFHATISNLYSVLHVTRSEDDELHELQFYHRSFLDFLEDQARSKIYFIRSQVVLQHCLKSVVRVLTLVSGAECIPPSGSYFPLQAFFTVVGYHDGKLEESALQQISQVRWKNFHGGLYFVDYQMFIQKIPSTWRPKIIRPSGLLRAASNTPDTFGFFRRCQAYPPVMLRQISAILVPERRRGVSYILGNGEQSVFLEGQLRQRYICKINTKS